MILNYQKMFKARYIKDDNKLLLAKKQYIHDEDFAAYLKVLRSISHRYINILKDAQDVSDDD